MSEMSNFTKKSMDLQTRKITFVQEFLKLQNEEIISGLENLLRIKREEEFERKLVPLSIDQFNTEIDQAMGDSENDRVTLAEELMQKVQKWG